MNLVKVDPHTLAAQLGVDFDAATPTQAKDVEVSNLVWHTGVRYALGNVTGDRSADTMRVVAACVEAGMTLDATRAVVNSRVDLAQRISGRNDDDVLQCWLLAIDERQHRRGESATIRQLAAGDFSTDPELPGDGTDAVETEIRRRLDVLRIDREARRRLDDEARPPVTLPPVKSLAALLDEPDTPTQYRIEGLAPLEARVMLAAQFKAGKSTLVENLLRSLVDGDQFLGRFAVNTTADRVVLIDNELSEHTLRRWLREQNIENTDAVHVVALRGQVGTFNLLDDRCRAGWAQRLRDLGCDYLALDCLRPVLDALGLDENRDAGRFLVAFDELLREAGIGDACLVQHMGHANERARGDSRLQDWPDAIWRLVRGSEEPDSMRYFTAYGRDVDLAEGQLDFDLATRRLTYYEGSRKAAKSEANAHDTLTKVIAILVEHTLGGGGGMNTVAIKAAVAERYRIGNRKVAMALELGESQELLSKRKGSRGALVYTLTNPCAVCAGPVNDPNRSTHHDCAPSS